MAVASIVILLALQSGLAAAGEDAACDVDVDEVEGHSSTVLLLQTQRALQKITGTTPSTDPELYLPDAFVASARAQALYPKLPAQWSQGIDSLQDAPPGTFDANARVSQVAYHKTGFQFSAEYMFLRSAVTLERFAQCWYASKDFIPSPTLDFEGCGGYTLADPPSGDLLAVEWPLEKAFVHRPTVHWIRDPVGAILSAYRYHKQSPEPWENVVGQSYAGSSIRLVSYLGVQNSTYSELQASLNESAGVIVEALNMQGVLAGMQENLMLWARDPSVLHLSVNHLKEDFNGTIACMNRFLGNRGLPETMLPYFNSLEVKPTSPHETSSKYNNTGLEQLLLREPVWGAEFIEGRKAIRKVFERQVDLWGCPLPPL